MGQISSIGLYVEKEGGKKERVKDEAYYVGKIEEIKARTKEYI